MAESKLDAYTGCLLGGAAGDALGAPVEFLSLAEIRRRFGPNGITEFVPAYGRVGAITDDTQMTLFTAEGLIRAANRRIGGLSADLPVMHRAYLRWYETQGGTSKREQGQDDSGLSLEHAWLSSHKELWSRRAPGNSCLSALASGRPGSIRDPINDSKGCGAVMRMAPVGLLNYRETLSGVFSLAAESAAITHGHPTGYLSAAVFAVVIAELGAGKELREAIGAAVAELVAWPDHEETLAAVNQAISLSEQKAAPSAEAVESLGGGWVAEEALAIALYAALVSDDFRSGVERAVNHSGDSDSTGAIAGNLLGLIHGAEAIPSTWAKQIELRDVIVQVATDLLLYAEHGGGTAETADMTRYPPN